MKAICFVVGFVAGMAAIVLIAVEPDMRVRRRWE